MAQANLGQEVTSIEMEHIGLEIRVLSNHFLSEVPYCCPWTHMYIGILLSVLALALLCSSLAVLIIVLYVLMLSVLTRT